jgi:hypothetical protein
MGQTGRDAGPTRVGRTRTFDAVEAHRGGRPGEFDLWAKSGRRRRLGAIARAADGGRGRDSQRRHGEKIKEKLLLLSNNNVYFILFHQILFVLSVDIRLLSVCICVHLWLITLNSIPAFSGSFPFFIPVHPWLIPLPVSPAPYSLMKPISGPNHRPVPGVIDHREAVLGQATRGRRKRGIAARGSKELRLRSCARLFSLRMCGGKHLKRGRPDRLIRGRGLRIMSAKRTQ